MTTMIELKNVKRVFGKQVAVELSDLNIEQGEIYGLIGPNGAGKSTIMKMICGLLEPSSGQVSVAGVAMSEAKLIGLAY